MAMWIKRKSYLEVTREGGGRGREKKRERERGRDTGGSHENLHIGRKRRN